jgi:predicted HicB family RNase H-like nuclease
MKKKKKVATRGGAREGAGRPAVADELRRGHRIMLNLRDEQHAELVGLAQRAKVSLSRFIVRKLFPLAADD